MTPNSNGYTGKQVNYPVEGKGAKRFLFRFQGNGGGCFEMIHLISCFMKGMLKFTGLVIALVICACGTTYEEPDTAIDAGRQFISAIYNGNFKRAGQLIIADEENRLILEQTIEKDFRARDGFGKEALSKASIQIREIKTTGNNTTLLYFNNAYTNKVSALEIKKEGEFWRVDLGKDF
jgi:hypothetical protein